MTETTTFLLVHGSWHGSWVWDRLRPELESRGCTVVTVNLPSVGEDIAALGNLTDDAATIGSAAAAIDGDVIVVAHSYGGAPTAAAVFGPNVCRLVFLAAFMPDDGRTYPSYLPPGPLPPYVGINDDGTMSVPAGTSLDAFYLDCPPDVAAWADARLRPQSQQVLNTAITAASWHAIPSTYVITTQDRAVPPDLQRHFATQASEVYEIASSHSPMLARPRELADLLTKIANHPVARGHKPPPGSREPIRS